MADQLVLLLDLNVMCLCSWTIVDLYRTHKMFDVCGKTRGDSICLAPENLFQQLVVGMLTVHKNLVYPCYPELLRKDLLHNCYL